MIVDIARRFSPSIWGDFTMKNELEDGSTTTAVKQLYKIWGKIDRTDIKVKKNLGSLIGGANGRRNRPERGAGNRGISARKKAGSPAPSLTADCILNYLHSGILTKRLPKNPQARPAQYEGHMDRPKRGRNRGRAR